MLERREALAVRDPEADITAALATWFDRKNLDVPVSTRIPNNAGRTGPDRFLRVYVIGADGGTKFTATPRFTLEAWARTETDAHSLWREASVALQALHSPLWGYKQYGAPFNNPHPDHPSYVRYSAQVGMTYALTPIKLDQ